ncbi:acyltransferase family protein [Agrilactobacillus composti DSM 18527 = JCM 14202]|uniref:Acyltransferase family protein n=1 Tax=Agrilactobacillus composti DSM 18527 = JCM 14202 TaxID=1423734 RepID=X0PTA0_9LACO|nr:1-acyl-sn-glycerol-3-phosphate acyltransferase [Agrilactobacillus composti]KRM36831.1 acyltransferase family protein [Agrilactobacillus composti DSM 18527 = JCM 14202]GAF41227.1 1-acyl-SN-glycerol-3-phosphate acyltransferase [Agrilactobacillus composti DSM 18527 = JCM 14202]
MLYSIFYHIIHFLLFLLNGNIIYENKEKLPASGYILVAPHRTWWEPVLFAVGAWPKKFGFMAKKELFKNPILNYILRHANAFPVDRVNPGPSVIKTPVRQLKHDNLSLIMFPTGTRYSSEMKSGAEVIAKLAGVPLIPLVYQGPLTFKGVLQRQKITIRFGEPITVDRKMKLNHETTQFVNTQLTAAWQKLDNEINPNFVYVPDTKKALAEKAKGEL